jgi:hypothetical protein
MLAGGESIGLTSLHISLCYAVEKEPLRGVTRFPLKHIDLRRTPFARRQRDRFMDRFKADDERFQVGTRVLWLILGTACATTGSALIMILMR